MAVSFWDDEFDGYYKTSRRIDIVGLACKSFLDGLYPGGGDQATRIAHLKNTELFKGLKRGLEVQVSFINPYCDYARLRSNEEQNTNCRWDMLDSINSIRGLYEDIRATPGDPGWDIKGRMMISLLSVNPYASFTCITNSQGVRRIARAGFLLRGTLGSACRGIRLEDEPDAVGAFINHMDMTARGNSKWLFEWNVPKGAVRFNDSYVGPAGYDLFMCYNSSDQVAVAKIESDLNASGRLLAWRDTRIRAGATWQQKIEEIIANVRCAAVFLGPDGLSEYQKKEVDLLENRKATIIPVILPGVSNGLCDEPPLSKYQRLDFRTNRDAALLKLIDAIEEANGWR